MTRPELRGAEEGRKGETKERRGRGRKEVVKRKGRRESGEREREEREKREKRNFYYCGKNSYVRDGAKVEAREEGYFEE